MFIYILALLAITLFYNYFWKRRKLPPGPPPLPLVGNVHTLSQQERWEDKFIEWSKTYGPTFTYWLGELPVIAICEFADMQKFFVKQSEHFSDRYRTPVDNLYAGNWGIALANGDSWREQRRFALKILRDFGLGKNQMEARIGAEIELLLEQVNKDIDDGIENIDFFNYTDMATGSVIGRIVLGRRFTKEHEDEFYRIKTLTSKITQSFGSPFSNLVRQNPWMLNLPIIKGRAEANKKTSTELIEYLQKHIDRHIEQTDYTQDMEPSDFVDAYLLERQKHLYAHGEEGMYSVRQLCHVCTELWVAGQETTSSVMAWVIAFMITYPEIQEKVHEELDRVVGNGGIIEGQYKSSLPYLNAVLVECQRCANITGQNMLRVNTKEVEVNGMHIETNTVFVPQISVLLQDPKVFPNPEKFDPTRYLTSDGKFKQFDEFIPFSLGKRICLGEGMAKAELFMFTANFLNQYKFSAASNPPVLKKVDSNGIMIVPYKCKIERRY
ncbi:unnamed protein product [Bursaphelenchus okinawaensis]|uniref:CYtochrome P450 family n=1 Tax=Bursaphelenchus okinawaensis TaxID=465554 RepID=A0A811K227_9BILA|nr:unnamed protein product [Bursaphelenchus okinawaensis]CAG9089557.1 unnamed protein product [Bursaphelenchus okinawaensis]